MEQPSLFSHALPSNLLEAVGGKTSNQSSPHLEHGQLCFFPGHFSQVDFETLKNEIPWKQNSIVLYGREHLVPRLEYFMGDLGSDYVYSGIRHYPAAWSKSVTIWREQIEQLTHLKFNGVLLNYYRSGRDYVAWHADDEKELGPNPNIFSISLGATRKFAFRTSPERLKQGLPLEKLSIELAHGDGLLMGSGVQKNYHHGILKTARSVGERISLTFRLINA